MQLGAETRIAVIARDFVAMILEERDVTLVLDPTHEGRQRLIDAIRAKLISEGQLEDQTIIARVLVPRG